MRKKIDSYLGFAKKSGNLVSGANTCTVTATRGRVKLLIIAEDIAENSREKMIKLAQSKNIPYVIYGLSDELSRITGTSGRSVFGITDRNFAQTIATVIE
ncbi:MAG: ribosomal L7Ae/L30e/S12e/Gadd45 family protein, partial [Anaerovoracaceae bacterium]